jgi:hypothetical protein
VLNPANDAGSAASVALDAIEKSIAHRLRADMSPYACCWTVPTGAILMNRMEV